MGRKLRYIPDGGALVEITCRTLQGRPLLRPSPELNDIAAGILGTAQRLYPVDLVAFSPLSNHYHILLFAKDARGLARFVGYFNSNLAREVSRLSGWTDLSLACRQPPNQVKKYLVDFSRYLSRRSSWIGDYRSNT
jgi:hypothetical protein